MGSTGKQGLTAECGEGRGRALQAEGIALPWGQVREHGPPRGSGTGWGWGVLLGMDSSQRGLAG